MIVALAGTAWAATKIGTNDLENGAVKTKKIANGAVTKPKLADNAVNSAKVKANSLTGEDLTAGAVSGGTDGVIADGTVTDADILDIEDGVSIPLASFLDCDTDSGAYLDFTNDIDTRPDFNNSAQDGQGFTIRFDDDDENHEICSQVMVPGRYASGEHLAIRYTKTTNNGAEDRLRCFYRVDGGSLDIGITSAIAQSSNGVVNCFPAFSPLPIGQDSVVSIGLALQTQADDAIDVHGVEFEFEARQ